MIIFFTIFKYELRYWLRQPSVYIYFGLLLFISTFTMAGAAGAFDEPSLNTASMQQVNSPIEIFKLGKFFNKLLLFLLPAIIGMAIYRDFRTNMHTVLYAYPITKRSYFFAKFLSSFLMVALISLGVVIGLYLGTQMPGVQPERLAPFNWMAYLQTYFIYLLPNMLFIGAIVFALVVWSRNIYIGFATAVGLLVLRSIIGFVLAHLDNNLWAGLLEPFGEFAIYFQTRLWTIVEQNDSLIPFSGLVAYNRIFWLSLAAVLLGGVYHKFDLQQEAPFFKRITKREKRSAPIKQLGQVVKIKLPTVQMDFSFWQQLKASWRMSNMELRYIVSSTSFVIILLLGLLFVILALLQMNPPNEIRILPISWFVLAFPSLFFSFVINTLTFLYAGMLIHRARMARLNQLVDVTPISNWSLLLSKFMALVKMQMLLLSLLMIGGIIVQTYQGYYNYQIGYYLFELYAVNLIGFVIWAFAAVFIQSLFNNPYLGFFLLVLGAMGIGGLPDLGIEQAVFRYNQSPNVDFFHAYSQMSGYSPNLGIHFTYKTYWFLCGLCLLLGALLFYVRGLPHSFKERLQIAGVRFQTKTGVLLGLFLIAFLGLGFRIYYEDNIERTYLTEAEKKAQKIETKARLITFENLPQPRITAVQLNLDLFPKKRALSADGTLTLVNKTGISLDTLLINTGSEVITTYSLDQAARTIQRDSVGHLDILRLEQPLVPGDSIHLSFQLHNKASSLLHPNTLVSRNGTFLFNGFIPNIGYWPEDTLSSPQDSNALQMHYRGRGADYIRFESTISTAIDQLAVAPGSLLKEWIEDERRYFHYKMDGKMTNDYIFNSGRYEVIKSEWEGTELEIYYHPEHDYNLDRMMRGMQASLAYNAKHFSPFQHPQLRIVEFTRTLGDFGQSFASIMPFSETSFIADVQADALDYPFIGTVHETAHQWWGHQVTPANVRGTRMITEGMAEYVSLRVLEQEYGPEHLQRFLQKAHDTYLKGRSVNREEQPLVELEGLSHLAYQKASLAYYALSDYIGKEPFNQAIRSFVDKVRFTEAPYTTSIEMIRFLREATPDSLQYLITDYFETISLYENQLKSVKVKPLPSGQYQLDLELNISKYRSNGRGERFYQENGVLPISFQDAQMESPMKSLPLADYIEVGIFGEVTGNSGLQGQVLQLRKHQFTQINNHLTIIVDQEPINVQIDPYLKLIDGNRKDNVWRVGE